MRRTDFIPAVGKLLDDLDDVALFQPIGGIDLIASAGTAANFRLGVLDLCGEEDVVARRGLSGQGQKHNDSGRGKASRMILLLGTPDMAGLTSNVYIDPGKPVKMMW